MVSHASRRHSHDGGADGDSLNQDVQQTLNVDHTDTAAASTAAAPAHDQLLVTTSPPPPPPTPAYHPVIAEEAEDDDQVSPMTARPTPSAPPRAGAAGPTTTATSPTTPAPSARPRAATHHIHYAGLGLDGVPGMDVSLAAAGRSPSSGSLLRSATVADFPGPPRTSSFMRRRRASTFRTVDISDFEELPHHGWHPGSEPGVDPAKPDGGHASMPLLTAESHITIVDFSKERIAIHELDNAELIRFLKLPQPGWAKCRWINVNGLSWDVIQALGTRKHLHNLAIEDIMNSRNRTKAEWFPNHAFLVLTLQRLVRDDGGDSDSSSSSSDSDDGASLAAHSRRSARGLAKKVRRAFGLRRPRPSNSSSGGGGNSSSGGIGSGSGDRQLEKGIEPSPSGLRGYDQSQPSGFTDTPPNVLRTLHRYQASSNDPRTEFMERHSPLKARKFAVACEQVSMFITNDNTIISFFELSADEVEKPILRRLQQNDTIIRQSCDASMVGQAIIDAIIDLAIPVTACYNDVIGDLELDVLTNPNLTHTKNLYIVVSEINKMLSFVNPIVGLIQTLRDHKTELSQEAATRRLQDPSQGVIITPMTTMYLADVLDHCVLITDSLTQLRGAADNMIDLIFNTISAYQNESIKQLTIGTLIFLPMTFLTGYFGQNFDNFKDLEKGTTYFWEIAGPLVFATILVLLRDVITQYFKSLKQRLYVGGLKREDRKRKIKLKNRRVARYRG